MKNKDKRGIYNIWVNQMNTEEEPQTIVYFKNNLQENLYTGCDTKIQLEISTVRYNFRDRDWCLNSFTHVRNSHNLKIVVMLKAREEYNQRATITENVHSGCSATEII